MDKDLIIIVMLSFCMVLHLMPRPYIRSIRRGLSRLVYWQWRKMSLVSARLYSWLYERLNGNNHD